MFLIQQHDNCLSQLHFELTAVSHFAPQDPSNDANNAPHQEQEVAAEEKLSNPNTDDEKAGAAERREEAHEEVQPHQEEQTQHEVKPVKQTDEHNELPEAPAAEQERVQEHGVPVHQGQPEI